MLLQINGSIAAPRGFRAGGYGGYGLITCGLPAVCAGVFGKNKGLSAPASWSSFLIEQGDFCQAILLCGTVAGICVGDEGYADAVRLAFLAGQAVGISSEKVLFAAAGEAGVRFHMEEAEDAILRLGRTLSPEEGAGESVAASISADGETAEIAVEFDIGEKKARIGGVCRRGEAFGILTTDAAISKEMLQRALRADAEDTFFMAMADGSRGSDCILCAASGMAGNKRITEEDGDYTAFCAALRHVTSFLARRMATRGKLVEISVQNAADKQTASLLARAAAKSVPLRTGISAGKADWESLLYALLETEAVFDPGLLDINLRSAAGSISLLRNGLAVPKEGDIDTILSQPAVTFAIDVKNGNGSAVAYAGVAE